MLCVDDFHLLVWVSLLFNQWLQFSDRYCCWHWYLSPEWVWLLLEQPCWDPGKKLISPLQWNFSLRHCFIFDVIMVINKVFLFWSSGKKMLYTETPMLLWTGHKQARSLSCPVWREQLHCRWSADAYQQSLLHVSYRASSLRSSPSCLPQNFPKLIVICISWCTRSYARCTRSVSLGKWPIFRFFMDKFLAY